MVFSFLTYFYTDDFDNRIIIKNNKKELSVRCVKNIVSKESKYLCSLHEENVVISTEDTFSFVIIFLACVFANKNIIVANNNNKKVLEQIPNSVIISEITEKSINGNWDFAEVNPSDIKISIYTSGTTSEPKIVNKMFHCINKESYDTIDILHLKQDCVPEFILTTPINHLYAITAYLFAGLNSQGVLNTDRIDYFESLDIKNSVLITSPSFLAYMQKYELKPISNPQIILSAGAKLKEDTHRYFEQFSELIDLYGSTETGFIAYKEKSLCKSFKLMKGISLIGIDESVTIVKSEYSLPDNIVLNDKILLNGDGTIEVIGRTDRIFKIQEKRVSATELEKEIEKNELVKRCCLVNLGDKIGAIVALNSDGIDFFLEKGISELTRLLKSDLLKNFEVVPQKWKYIDEIPTTGMGKIDKDKINEIFSLNLSLPFIVKKRIDKNSAEFDLYFYRNCNFFKGHFDEFPIVAGVVQLFYASFFSKKAFEDVENCHIGQIKRVKFSNIIHPDTIVTLKLQRSEHSISFEYCDKSLSYSSGCLPLENIFMES